MRRIHDRGIKLFALILAVVLASGQLSADSSERATTTQSDSVDATVTKHQESVFGKKLERIDGQVTTLGDYLTRGPIYVNFWAIWCEPCKQELRALKKFVEEHGHESFTIVAVNIDNAKSLAKVKAYVRSQNYSFPVIIDPNQQLFQCFNGQRLPFGILLNRSGKIVTTRTSYLPGDEKEIGREILELVEP